MIVPTTLAITNITLRPLAESHIDALSQIATNKVIWTHAPYPFYEPELFRKKWLDKAFSQIEQQKRICFTVFCAEKIVGSSSLYAIDHDNKTLNIGYTWFDPACWGTAVNATSKLLLLSYSFEQLYFNRVGFSIDSINRRSCNALRKFGITEEGTLRNHLILPDGRVRSSVIFSVILDEWPTIKHNLCKKVGIACT